MSDLRSILKLCREAKDRGEDICLATVVGVEGSSYRKPGARMLLTSGGRRAGTISGGCLEAEVQKKAWWLTESGPSVQRYSSFFDDDSEMPYGLGCGGTVFVLLERGETAERVLSALETALNSREPIVLASVTASPSSADLGTRLILSSKGESLFDSAVPEEVVALARQSFRDQRSLWHHGPTSIFAEYLTPRVGLLVVGAGDDAVPLVEFAERLGWKTTVVDGRAHMATRERFPAADEVFAPRSFDTLSLGGRDAAVILTHSYEQDRAALRALLPSDAGYVGLLGPRQRTERLLSEVAPALGLTIKQCLARLHTPVGLSIGAKDPTSIALAIVAEIHAAMEKAGSKPSEKAGCPPAVLA